jgi:membrane protein DedA with SNARE-associated domain
VLETSYILLFSAWEWLLKLRGLGLMLLGLSDNSPVPVLGGTDALTIILSAEQPTSWPYYGMLATIGSVAGGCMTFMVGRKGGQKALEKRLPTKKVEKIFKGFEKHGFYSVFIPGLLPPPVPYMPFLLAAGALQYSPRKFFLALGLARTIRYSTLAYLGSRYSTQIFGFFHQFYRPILWVLIGAVVIGGIGLIWWMVRRKREGKPVVPGPKETAKAA